MEILVSLIAQRMVEKGYNRLTFSQTLQKRVAICLFVLLATLPRILGPQLSVNLPPREFSSQAHSKIRNLSQYLFRTPFPRT